MLAIQMDWPSKAMPVGMWPVEKWPRNLQSKARILATLSLFELVTQTLAPS